MEEPKPKSGRPEKLKPRCKRRLIRMEDRNKFKPIHYIASKFRTADEKTVCERTIKEYVTEMDYGTTMQFQNHTSQKSTLLQDRIGLSHGVIGRQLIGGR